MTVCVTYLFQHSVQVRDKDTALLRANVEKCFSSWLALPLKCLSVLRTVFHNICQNTSWRKEAAGKILTIFNEYQKIIKAGFKKKKKTSYFTGKNKNKTKFCISASPFPTDCILSSILESILFAYVNNACWRHLKAVGGKFIPSELNCFPPIFTFLTVYFLFQLSPHVWTIHSTNASNSFN